MNNPNLIIVCPDQPGIVRVVTDFLYQAGANLSYLEQHIEEGYFFMRVEWEHDFDQGMNEKVFHEAFKPIISKFNMLTRMDFHDREKTLGLFCSKELHCLIDILGRILTKEIDVTPLFIISNARGAENIAHMHRIPFFFIPTPKGESQHEVEQLKIIKRFEPTIIGLARYMKVLSEDFLSHFSPDRIINVHHSFLPSFVGARPYHEAHERGVKLIGASAHYVIPHLDQGPIIEQGVKHISHTHSIDGLKLAGRELEKEVFAFAIKKHLENKLVAFKNRVVVFS